MRLLVTELKSKGARPFIVPAMGSHGGASAQRRLTRRDDTDLVEAELLVRGHGRGHMPRMRRIEGPT